MGSFPPAAGGNRWMGDPDRGFGKEQPGGWIYCLLPYMEQQHLFDLPSDGNGDVLTKEQMDGALTLAQTPLSTMHCPSRRRCVLYPVTRTLIAYNASFPSGGNLGSARTDYAANCGVLSNQNTQIGPTTIDGAKGHAWTDTSEWGGICYERSEVRIRDITDGLSNTILLGEKYLNPDNYYTSESFRRQSESVRGILHGPLSPALQRPPAGPRRYAEYAAIRQRPRRRQLFRIMRRLRPRYRL